MQLSFATIRIKETNENQCSIHKISQAYKLERRSEGFQWKLIDKQTESSIKKKKKTENKII